MRTPWANAVWIAPFAVVTALGAAWSCWMAVRGEGAGHLFMVFVVALVTAPLLALLLLAVRVLTSETGRGERMKFTLLAGLATASCIGALQVPGFLAASTVREGQIADAKAWCVRLATKIEDQRGELGAYPESIEGSGLVADAPELCDPRWLYRRSVDGSFELSFYTGFDAQWTWRSRDRSWAYST
jgi:hypothetical protein